jgi:hypothetical protein
MIIMLTIAADILLFVGTIALREHGYEQLAGLLIVVIISGSIAAICYGSFDVLSYERRRGLAYWEAHAKEKEKVEDEARIKEWVRANPNHTDEEWKIWWNAYVNEHVKK